MKPKCHHSVSLSRGSCLKLLLLLTCSTIPAPSAGFFLCRSLTTMGKQPNKICLCLCAAPVSFEGLWCWWRGLEVFLEMFMDVSHRWGSEQHWSGGNPSPLGLVSWWERCDIIGVFFEQHHFVSLICSKTPPRESSPSVVWGFLLVLLSIQTGQN